MSHTHSFICKIKWVKSPTCTQQWDPDGTKRENYKIKNSSVKKYYCYKKILQANFWKDKTVCYKNYYKYETKLRKWEAYYSIYRKMVPVAGDSLIKEQILERLFINVVVGESLIKEYY